MKQPYGTHTPEEWEIWRDHVSGGEGEDLAFVFKHVRRGGSSATKLKWARDFRTRTFCDLGLYLIDQHHIRRDRRQNADQYRIFANVSASDLRDLASSGFFATSEEAECLSVDRFNDTWGQQSSYCSDLIHYLFRPEPYLRRLRVMHPKLLQAAAEMPLGEWVRHTAKTEITSVLASPLVSLHTFIETVMPKDPNVQEHVHDLRLRRLDVWADLYMKAFTAYGAPLRADRENLDWASIAERFSTMAGGTFLRAQTRPEEGAFDAALLGQTVVELLPSLLAIAPSDIETRTLQTPLPGS